MLKMLLITSLDGSRDLSKKNNKKISVTKPNQNANLRLYIFAHAHFVITANSISL